MRKHLAALALASSMATASLAAAPAPAERSEPSATTPVAVQQVRIPVPPIRDEIAMVLVGTALIGLAAAVRRAA
jgi:hypothetical protein